MSTNNIGRELRSQSNLIRRMISDVERLIELRATPERRALLRTLRAEGSKLEHSRRLLERPSIRVPSKRGE